MATTRSTRRSARLATSAELTTELTKSGGSQCDAKPKHVASSSPVISELKEPKIKLEFNDEVPSSKSPAVLSENSLDILARVAHGHLTDESTHISNKTTKAAKPGSGGTQIFRQHQLMKKTAGSKHTMTLEEIWRLTDRQLVHMFSELTSNELTRNFAYTCYLMPEKCAEIFTSFGNESKAKNEMQYHLLDHLRTLLSQAKANQNFFFTAQTVQSRKKYGLDKIGNKKKKLKESIVGKKPTGDSSLPGNDGDIPLSKAPSVAATATTLITNVVEQKDDKPQDDNVLMEQNARRGRRSTKADTLQRQPPRKLVQAFKKQEQSSKKQEQVSKKQEQVSKKQEQVSKKHEQVPNQQDVNPYVFTSTKVEPPDLTEMDVMPTANDKITRSPKTGCITVGTKDNKMLPLDMFKNQPYIDHSYFTICLQKEKRDDSKETSLDFGTSRTSGWKYRMNEEMDEDDKQILNVIIRVHSGMMPAPNKLYIPIVRVPKAMALAAQYLTDSELDTQADEQISSAIREGSLQVAGSGLMDCDSDEDEEDEYFEDTEPLVPNRKRFDIGDTSQELERNMALKYIRELRCKKKDDTALICKICKTKAFTATATLMYHYRSHAGIKPFVCLICNTTFTRQHSLNYHMLIHNNQNRFTCKDCGRMFRHPSHFKEHMRRHTGETPFLCTDCPLRFKTRNTYKRHLKTRHGKLLLSDGIRVMSREEFLRVRTKPYLHERLNVVEVDKSSDDIEEQLELLELSRRQMSRPAIEMSTSRKPAILSHSSSSSRTVNNLATNISFHI